MGIHKQSLRGPVIDLCGITALLVAAMFTLLLVSLEHLRNDQNRSRRSSDLVTQTAQVEASVLDTETGLRGFLLSNNRIFLQPYHQAKVQLPGELSVLGSLAEGPQENREVRQIRSSISAYVDSYAQPLIDRAPRLDVSADVKAAVKGKTLADGIRRQLTRLESTNSAFGVKERMSAKGESDQAILFGAIGLGLSVLLLVVLAIYLVRRFLDPMRTVAAAARDLAAGRLTTRVPEVGLGEVAELARSFNAMAGTLQTRSEELSKVHERLERAVDQAHGASEMKSNFLANMSHEIRTPLNGLVGSMELLSDTPLNEDQQEFVDLARASGEALRTVVNDVLDIAKIEAGRVEIEHRDFDLYDLVEGACDVVAAAASNKGLELQSMIAADVPPMVRGDRARVSQILTNLLSNAVKFTSTGEVGLEVSVVTRAGSQVKLRFEVRDTGIGIEFESLQKLFEPFTQADAGTTRTYGGTGLGLTIARELTAMMHGSLSVESVVGKGSRFGFELPLMVPDRKQQPPIAPEELAGLRVLIVSDKATNRKIFANYLSNWGMRPSVAQTAAGGLGDLRFAAAQGNPFSVVLIDDPLGGRSGVALAGQIAGHPLLDRLAIIVLSQAGRPSRRNLPSAVVACVHKPVRQSKLLDAVSRAVRGVGRVEESVTPVTSAAGRPRGRRILVAEDHDINWMLVERLLAKRGHVAVNAGNGEEVLELLAEEDFDLVFMDCQMPVMDGYEATRRLRQREPKAERIPVVAMTAHAMHGDRERCLAAGMDDYLAKPISGAAIDEILARWLPDEHSTSNPSPPLDASPPLDQTRMEELRSLFPGREADEMITQLQADVDGQFQRLAAAIHDCDAVEVAQAAHRIKGSAQMVGAVTLAEAAGQLQEAAEQRPEDIDRAADQLREYWRIASAALEGERTESAPEAAVSAAGRS